MEVTYGKREGKDRKKVRWTRRKNKGEMKMKKNGRKMRFKLFIDF